MEGALDAHTAEHGVDLRAAAVDQNGVDAHVLEQRHIFENLVGQQVVDHGISAILDDHGLSPQTLDVGKSLDEDIRLVDEKLITVIYDLILRHDRFLLPC